MAQIATAVIFQNAVDNDFTSQLGTVHITHAIHMHAICTEQTIALYLM